MGTPASPLYSIITFGHHENQQILTKYKSNLIFYKRFIDDIFGVWLPTNNSDWSSFKTLLDQFGTLQCNIEELMNSTTFLDLQLTIEGNLSKTKTFQKPMNLYSYIPPISAHPLGCFKGLIMGELLRYWRQNSDSKDFIEITSLFFQCLLHWGQCIEQITPLFHTAALLIDNNKQTQGTNQQVENSNNTLFIHWEYHPGTITNRKIRQIYNEAIHKVDNFDQMRIALSRPKNLRDLVCNSKLPLILNRKASDFLTIILNSENPKP